IARRVSDVLLVESRQPGAEQVVVLQGRLGTSDIPQLVRICAGATRLTGVLAHLRDAQGQTSLVTLQGSPYVHHTIGSSLRLRAHARSFFQANRFLLDDLVAAVSAEVPPDADVLDLYAGVGLFAIAAADRARSIRAAELDALATEDARENAHQRLCDKITFESLDVLAALTAWPTKRAETIILDPPRAGAGAAVIDAILARHPEKIIAVACDPPTLGRDLARLISGGYALRSLRLLDLFPGTFHLETIAVLTPAAA
ncbi:MAG: methyltransferase, partial [Vicinamibacteria bacterium]|nr:methyltransferase [Vicinamibacteria bacterium]